MAEFNEKVAKELQETHDLPKSTVNKWRYRGRIPDRFFKNPVSVTEEKAHAQLSKRVAKVLQADFLNKAVICKLAGCFTKQVYNADFKPAQIITLKKEINTIKVLIAKTFEKKSDIALKNLLNDERLFLKPILQGQENMYYDRAKRFKKSEIEIDSVTYAILKDSYVKAAMQLNV